MRGHTGKRRNNKGFNRIITWFGNPGAEIKGETFKGGTKVVSICRAKKGGKISSAKRKKWYEKGMLPNAHPPRGGESVIGKETSLDTLRVKTSKRLKMAQGGGGEGGGDSKAGGGGTGGGV